MNKKAGLIAYLFWIILGAVIGGYISLKWFCR